MGHGRILSALANNLVKHKKSIIIVSDTDYSSFFIFNSNVKFIVLPKTDHVNHTIGGMYSYKYSYKILDIIEKKKVECVIFSTFFDPELVRLIKNKEVKTILLSYFIRDSFRRALINRRAYELFDKIISLYDPSVKTTKLRNEIIVNPLKLVDTKKRTHPKHKYDILITCGGGGRPSSSIMIRRALNAITRVAKTRKRLNVILISGGSRYYRKINWIKHIKWTHKFEEVLDSSCIVISEAGYYTMLNFINHNKYAIIIPGQRIIDNQELRALELERVGLAKVFFPFEDDHRLSALIEEALDNKNKHVSTSKINRLFTRHDNLLPAILRELQ